jgi:hypothetical protein
MNHALLREKWGQQPLTPTLEERKEKRKEREKRKEKRVHLFPLSSLLFPTPYPLKNRFVIYLPEASLADT